MEELEVLVVLVVVVDLLELVGGSASDGGRSAGTSRW